MWVIGVGRALETSLHLWASSQAARSPESQARMALLNALKGASGTSLVVQWLRPHSSTVESTDLIPGRETWSHMLQLRVRLPKLKMQHAANKTWHSYIYIYIKFFFYSLLVACLWNLHDDHKNENLLSSGCELKSLWAWILWFLNVRMSWNKTVIDLFLSAVAC